MACSITIDGVFGLGAGPSIVRVVGSVVDCPPDVEGNNLVVGVSCASPDGPFNERSTQADASGNWQVLISNGTQAGCRCDAPIFVRARCTSAPDCSVEFRAERLLCVDCPEITFPGDDVIKPVFVECNPDGTASVTVNFFIKNTTSTFLYIILNPGIGGTAVSGGAVGITPGGSFFATAVLQYPTPSSPQPFIEILDINLEPTGCAPIPIPVPPIEPCEAANCPVITRIEVEFLDCELDPADGILKRRVRFTPSLAGPEPVAHDWSFGDGKSDGGLGPPGIIEHLYDGPPTFPPELCVTGPEGCPRTCQSVQLTGFDVFEPCQCPELVTVGVTIGDCERDPTDQKLKRKVTFNPTFSGPPPSSHQWDFGDGTVDFNSGPPGQKVHLYEAKPANTPRLCIKGPDPKCEEKCHEIPLSEFDPFQACGDGPPPIEDDESSGCGALRLIVAVAGAMAILAALLAICVPAAATALFITAGVLAALAAIAGILYAIFCRKKPCEVALLISGQSTLGAGAAAIILSACCPWMIWAGFALVASGMGLLLLWRSRCNKSVCALAKEITKIIGGIVLPLIGFVVIIPGLALCVNGVALAWVSAVFGLIAVYAASCE
jgi:hypothetical protein